MLTVGITGGIGSGKTTICRIFETFGIPVFYADTEARLLLETDAILQAGIIEALGEDTYVNRLPDRKKIASLVFGRPDKLAQLNALVHPATARRWQQWQQQHPDAPYLLKEAAILFESGAHQTVNNTICVTAPENLRLQRAMQRDGLDEATIRKRMAAQMPEDKKTARCDFVILNNDLEAVLPQVLAVHGKLLLLNK